MEVKIVIDPKYAVPEVVVYANSVNEQVSGIVKALSAGNAEVLPGYREDDVYLLAPSDIISIYAQGQKVFARCEDGIYRIKYRLYELEEMFSASPLLRISHSEIVNFKKVAKLDLSIGGTISLKFKNGGTAFVSRRYMERIKKYISL